MAVGVASATAAERLPERSVTLDPDGAGRATSIVVDVDPRQVESPDSLPESLAIAFQRGFRFDARARPGRCSDEQARNVNCPDSSRIGRGEARGTATVGVTPVPFTATIDLFLARAKNGGDIADVIIEVREPQSKTEISARGRFTPFESGQFAAELRFKVGQANDPPAGVTKVEVERLTLRAGAQRTVKVRRRVRGRTVTRRRRLSLITNPRVCRGEYLIRLSARYPDRTVERDAAPACTPRA